MSQNRLHDFNGKAPSFDLGLVEFHPLCFKYSLAPGARARFDVSQPDEVVREAARAAGDRTGDAGEWVQRASRAQELLNCRQEVGGCLELILDCRRPRFSKHHHDFARSAQCFKKRELLHAKCRGGLGVEIRSSGQSVGDFEKSPLKILRSNSGTGGGPEKFVADSEMGRIREVVRKS